MTYRQRRPWGLPVQDQPRPYKPLGLAMRAVRQHLGRSQDAVAQRMGCTRPHLSTFENGHALPQPDVWERWLAAVGEPGVTGGDRQLADLIRQAKHRYQQARDEETEIPAVVLEAEREQVIATARASMTRAAAIESAAVGTVTLEQLADEVIGIARAYPTAPPIALFGEMTRLQDRTDELLERTRRPAQIRDLYMISGLICGLLAGASFDLGHPAAAEQQAHAARAYAEVAGDAELSAWAAGMLATTAFWSGRLDSAVAHVDRGLATSPDGAPQVALYSIAARAFALMDDPERTRAAIRAAGEARERAGRSRLHDHVGGQFAFSPARQAFSNGSALLRIRDLKAAAKECETAVELYGEEPGSRRGYAARVDLAATRLLGEDLDGAAEALEPVLALPSTMRVATIVQRLQGVGGILSQPRFRGAPPAAQLTGQLADFFAHTALRALPPPSR